MTTQDLTVITRMYTDSLLDRTFSFTLVCIYNMYKNVTSFLTSKFVGTSTLEQLIQISLFLFFYLFLEINVIYTAAAADVFTKYVVPYSKQAHSECQADEENCQRLKAQNSVICVFHLMCCKLHVSMW